jgi:hypothetical protein
MGTAFTGRPKLPKTPKSTLGDENFPGFSIFGVTAPSVLAYNFLFSLHLRDFFHVGSWLALFERRKALTRKALAFVQRLA